MKLPLSLFTTALVLLASVAPALAAPRITGKYYAKKLQIPTGRHCTSYTSTLNDADAPVFGAIRVKKGQHVVIETHLEHDAASVINPLGIQSDIEVYPVEDVGYRNMFIAQHNGNYVILSSMEIVGEVGFSGYTVCVY
jgi:hypothetical protein